MFNKYDQTNVPQTIEERVAEMEAKFASSWALRTKAEFESEFKERIKNEILGFAVKIGISALILLGGAGYIFIKSANTEVYQGQNKQVINDLKAKYDENLAEERTRFEWKRQHDYGKNYIYLAEFYYNSDIMNTDKKSKLISEQLARAETYLNYAMRSDPQQATTYWELGEIHYTYSHKFGIKELLDSDKALYYYKLATKLYTNYDIAKGWRADAYRMIAKIELDKAKQLTKKDEISKTLTEAQTYLEKARDEYTSAIPESRDYNKDRIQDVDNIKLAISKSTWNK